MMSSATSSSSSFYIVLPSNTNVDGNRTNSYRVHLPRKLQFNSQWSVGLAVLVYPHSWPTLGTSEPQFVRVEWQTGEHVHIPVPAGSVSNPQELLESLHRTLGEGSERLASELRTLQNEYHRLQALAEQKAEAEAQRLLLSLTPDKAETKPQQPAVTNASAPRAQKTQSSSSGNISSSRQAETTSTTPLNTSVVGATTTTPPVGKEKEELANLQNTKRLLLYRQVYPGVLKGLCAEQLSERDRALLDVHLPLGLELWIHSYRKARMACVFNFDESRQRFRLKLDKRRIRVVELSTQLAYILGFSTPTLTEPVNLSQYPPDMKGGVSTFYVYAPGLIEPVIIGDCVAPVLRVVNIRGAADEMVEECYNAVQYHKLVVKEISEIFIEIRTSSGQLMPFQYGTCTLTLHFKKIPYF
uniref:Uncharacterized protein n=1 Tax=Globodera pallida TaxID=36090 RepID=A0A183BNZ5_GLOPA